MDKQSQMTPPYAHDQAEDPIRIHHPEEEEHQENGASKMLRKVKAKAKKIKNSLTKHGQHDQDVDEEDDEDDEQEPEVHGAAEYESSAVRGGVTGQPESLSHLGEANVPAPEEIIPPGTKVFPVVSSDYARPVEAEPLRDASYGHEAPSHPLRVADISEREESREAHHMPINTPVSLLSATEDVTRTFAPGEDEFLGGQRKVNIETPKRLEVDPAGGSGYLSGVRYESKVTDPTHEGGGEAGVPGIAESLGRMKVTDESPDQKSGLGFERDLPTRSHDFAPKNESGIRKDSPAGFGGESGTDLRIDSPTRSHELFDQKIESVGKNSPAGYGGESEAGLEKDFPTRSHEFGVKTESGIDKNSPTGLGAGLGESPSRSREIGLKTESGIGKDSSKGTGGELGAGIGEDFPARSHELGLESASGIEKDSLPGGHGYGEESEEKNFPARSDDVKVKTGLGSDFPTGTHDQFSPELSRPIERDDFESKAEETQEPKPSTYTDMIASATSAITDKAIAAKNAVASRLGYAGGDLQHESPVGGETPRSAEKLSPVYEKVKETGSTVMTKLPLSGGGSGPEAQQVEDKGVSTRDYLAEKLRPGEEDKALSEMIADKLHLGGGGEKKTTTKEVEVTVEKIPTDQIPEEREAIAEEGKEGGGGMVGKLKGAVTSWLGGTTEEVKPKKSSASVEESSQSLGSTVGDSGGAVPTQRGLQQSGN